MIAPARTVAAHVDVPRSRFPRRWGVGVIGKAESYVCLSQDCQHPVFVPAFVPEFKSIPITSGQHAEKGAEPLRIFRKIWWH